MANNAKLNRILNQVLLRSDEIKALSDEELRGKTAEFKQRLENGEKLNSLLPEAFAVVCEADERVLGMRPFNVQILGAIALHNCYLAEMNTGEGKTLTATMPLYLNALTGKSTILVTANEYLAYRDAMEMGPVYEFLGLTVKAGVKGYEESGEEQLSNEEKRAIYSADIVYTTHGVLGFDYLLNNLVKSADDRFLREFNYVIIDEADSVLLDAAQMPLVISGAPRVQSNLYEITDFFVSTLIPDRDYEEENKTVWLTKKGVRYAENFFRIKEFYAANNFEINRHTTLALRAHTLFEKEKDYVITDNGEMSLLDNGTGRVMQGMKLRGGMHQAIEAKEKVEISQENRSMASITYQNLFRMFPRMAGMSGTIADAKKELKDVYKEKVAVIPPNKPMARKDLQDRYFKTSEEQYEAAVEEIIRRHETGQPILVVASKIKDTEHISAALMKKKIPHTVLNANSAFWEAQIIKEAGRKNAVTVSTGMAGRGTDIKLGEGVIELGGLAVIGIGRMANVRLERQARGRAGRQGEPGISQFFVSLEDDVVSSIGEKKQEKLLKSSRSIGESRLKRLINGAQTHGEESAVGQRKNSVDYDKVVKRQREIIYSARDRLLDGMSLSREVVMKLTKENIREFIESDEKLTKSKISRFVLDNLSYDLDGELIKRRHPGKRKVRRTLVKYAKELLEKKEGQLPSEEYTNEMIRLCALKALDDAWIEQVDYLQQLQYAISGRGSAQRNPVFEYQKEAFESFNRMQVTIKTDIMRYIFLCETNVDAEGKLSILFP